MIRCLLLLLLLLLLNCDYMRPLLAFDSDSMNVAAPAAFDSSFLPGAAFVSDSCLPLLLLLLLLLLIGILLLLILLLLFLLYPGCDLMSSLADRQFVSPMATYFLVWSLVRLNADLSVCLNTDCDAPDSFGPSLICCSGPCLHVCVLHDGLECIDTVPCVRAAWILCQVLEWPSRQAIELIQLI
jgi:hypothetical protein